MIDLTNLRSSFDGALLVFATPSRICQELRGPSWASTCAVGAYGGADCWVVESELIADGDPVVAASDLLGVYAVDAATERSIPVFGAKLCSSAALADPEGCEPDGAWIWVRYDA